MGVFVFFCTYETEWNIRNGGRFMKNYNENAIYELNAPVPLKKAFPIGMQHVLTMFVNNITPILVIGALCNLTAGEKSVILQNAMFIAGIFTLIQCYKVWRFGANLPIVMGTSAGFIATLTAASAYGYKAVLGACFIGGLFEVLEGFFVKPLKKFFPPVVTGTVIMAIGLSLMPTGVKWLAGGAGTENYGSWQNLLVGFTVLMVVILTKQFTKGFTSIISILIGIIVGIVMAGCFGMLDFSGVGEAAWIGLPHFMPYSFEFHKGAIIPLLIMFIVTAVETIGDASAIAMGGLKREATDAELSGAVLADGLGSAVAALFGVLPNTSMSQNVGLVCMTKVVNRFCCACGAVFLIACGFCPKLGAVLSALPNCVLGGATVLPFSMIVISGMQMVFKEKMSGRNGVIVALALGLGTGLSSSGALAETPELVQLIFSQSGIVAAFIIATVLNLVLPKDMEKTETVSQTKEEKHMEKKKVVAAHGVS